MVITGFHNFLVLIKFIEKMSLFSQLDAMSKFTESFCVTIITLILTFFNQIIVGFLFTKKKKKKHLEEMRQDFYRPW